MFKRRYRRPCIVTPAGREFRRHSVKLHLNEKQKNSPGASIPYLRDCR